MHFEECCATVSPKRRDHRNSVYNARIFTMAIRSFVLYANCTLFAIAPSRAPPSMLPQTVATRPLHLLRSPGVLEDAVASARHLPCGRTLFLETNAHLVASPADALRACGTRRVCTFGAPGFILGSNNSSVVIRMNASGLLALRPWNRPRGHLWMSGMRF